MSVNIDRVLELADVIEKQPHTSCKARDGFSMETYFHVCGTPSCIAGWAIHLYDEKPGRNRNCDIWVTDDLDVARKILGIDFRAAETLFVPNGLDWSKITPSQAASTLRHFAKTGEVNWEVGQ